MIEYQREEVRGGGGGGGGGASWKRFVDRKGNQVSLGNSSPTRLNTS